MAETQDLHDRMTRANSWIEAATRMRVQAEHRHTEFLLLYVAFNGLYGRRQYEETRTQVCDDLDDFLVKVEAMRHLDEAEGGAGSLPG